MCPVSTGTPERSTNTTRTNRDQSSAGGQREGLKTTSKQKPPHPTTTMTTHHPLSPFTRHSVAYFPVLRHFSGIMSFWYLKSPSIVCLSSCIHRVGRDCRKIFTYAAAMNLLRRPRQLSFLDKCFHHW